MASAITHFYPDIEVSSAGTHCELGEFVPLQTLDTLKNWGIEPTQRRTKPLPAALREGPFDLILCADSSVYRDVASYMGSTEGVMDITGLTARSELIPFDPSKSGATEFMEQLAKVVFLSVRAIRRLLVPEERFNYSLLLSGDSEGFLARKAVIWAMANSKLIVDTNWSRPNLEGWQKLVAELAIPIHLYSPFSGVSQDYLKHGHINISRFETDHFETQILSQRWNQFLNQFEQSGKLLISGFEPQSSLSITELALGLLHTDISIVSLLEK
jgi:protein-tyrosine-phosphatase